MLYSINLKNNHYLCIEFFMVLDFKVNTKIGCRDDNQFFYALSRPFPDPLDAPVKNILLFFLQMMKFIRKFAHGTIHHNDCRLETKH